MMSNRRWMLRLGFVVLAQALGMGTAVTAQEPEALPLQSLLSQLAKTGPQAWQTRAAAIKAAATKAEQEAKTLREQAKVRNASAVREDKASKALTAEIEKLTQLRAMLGKLLFRDPAKGERGKLEAALEHLRKLPAAAWDARVLAMKTTAATHEKAAATLRSESAALLTKANAKVASAKALGEELGKLAQLKKLVSGIRLDLLAAAFKARTKPAEATAKKTALPKAKPAPAKPKKATAKPKKTADASSMPSPPPAKTPAQQQPINDKALVTYLDHTRPIFEEHCFSCHDSEDPSGGLDLSTYAAAIQGGSSGRTLVPGNPDGSRLYLLVAHLEKPKMPKGEPKLDKELIKTIRRWIADGAPKDLAQGRQLASKRATARAKAAKLASSAKSKQLEVVMPGELPRTKKAYPARPGAMRAVAASPAAPLLAVPGFCQVLLMHQDNLRELGVLEFPFGRVEALSFSGDGTVLLAAGGTTGKSGGTVLYDVRTGRELGQFGQQRDVVLSAAVSPHGKLVAVGGTRRRLEVFRVVDGEALWQQPHEDWVTAISFSQNGELLASADRKGFVQVREAANGREVHTMKAADGLLADLAFSPNSALLATAGGDRSVCLFRMRDGRRLFRQQAHRDQVLCITWRTQNRLVTGGADGRLMHWKTDGSREPELPAIGEWVYGVAASKDGTRVFATDWQGRLAAIDAKTRKVLASVMPLAVTQ